MKIKDVNKNKFVDEFKGFTIDGFDVIFYINNSVYYKDGSFICSPRCIFISRNKEYKLTGMKFDTLRFSGGILNRFYTNRNMIEFDPKEKDYFKFKEVEETISEEYGLFASVKKAVDDRDDITHNNTVRLDGISIGIYEMLLKLNYAMIMDYIGVSVEIYGDRIQYLSLRNII